MFWQKALAKTFMFEFQNLSDAIQAMAKVSAAGNYAKHEHLVLGEQVEVWCQGAWHNAVITAVPRQITVGTLSPTYCL